MNAVGIDLAGPANVENTAMVALRSDGGRVWRVDTVVAGATDREIRSFVASVDGPVTIGLDAPLSYEPGGGLRASDTALRRELAARGFERHYVLPPTMTRMIYLTARGMTVARMCADFDDVRLFETHPIAALLFRGISEDAIGDVKESDEVRRQIVGQLDDIDPENHLDELVVSDHTLSAIAAAVAARDAAGDQAAWRYPADPPQHPFPLVC